MGLDTSHGCWHGAYSAFMRWRQEVARAAGLPPLELMEGFFSPQSSGTGRIPTFYLGTRRGELEENSIKWIEERLPIAWECLEPDALHELLYHSDFEGEIPWQSCAAIADSLERLLPEMQKGNAGGHIGDWQEKTQTFIKGLRAAASKQENVEFH